MDYKAAFSKPAPPDPVIVSGDELLAMCRAGRNITGLKRTKKNGFWEVILNEPSSNTVQRGFDTMRDAK